MRLPPKQRCVKNVWKGFGSYQCRRAIKNVENGHGYCTQHTPSLIKAKNEEKHAKWHTEYVRRNLMIDTRLALLIAVKAASGNLPVEVQQAVDRYREVRGE